MLSSALHLGEISIPPFSVVVGQDCMQHAGPICRGEQSLQYHIFFIPVQNVLKEFNSV